MPKRRQRQDDDQTVNFKSFQYQKYDTTTTRESSSKRVNSKKYKPIQVVRKELAVIQDMRQKKDAPVDTMGCHKTCDQKTDPNTKAFQTLIGVLLSVQTTDQKTYEVMNKLTKKGLSIKWALDTPTTVIKELINSVNFNKKKAENVKKIAEIIHEQYDDVVPSQYEQLVKFPGIGPKIAHVFLRAAFGKNTGIGVDVHVHRIVNRLNWVKTSQPTQTQKALQALLKQQEWSTINQLLVGFGQQICRSKPRCKQCRLVKTCPYEYKEMF